MPQIATIPAPDKYKLNQAMKKQKKATKNKKRDTHLENLDNLLSRIPPLSQYQPIKIKDRAAISHFFENMFFILYIVFNLI